jgi:hypothetical protein
MDTNDRINKIIQQFLDSKGNYDSLKPIIHIDRGYGVCRKFGFDPTDGKFKSYDAPPQFKDDSARIKFIKKLNQDITNYNEKIDISQHPEIDSFPYYSFLVIRDGYEYVDKQLYVEIVDEELYKLKEDEDFIPRFNRTIYEYLISKKESAQAEDRWDEKNIWYIPYRNFGDWFDKQPEYVDAKPYFYSTSGKINWTEPLWKLALKMRQKKDGGDFKTYMDAYRYAVKQYNHYGEPIDSPKKLRKAIENSGQEEVVNYLEDSKEKTPTP